MTIFSPIKDAGLDPLGYQQITNLTSAVGLTVPEGATRAFIQAEAQQVRWRDDNTNPTTSVGMVLDAGSSIYYVGDLSKIKFIEITASAKLNVTYYN